MEPFDFSTLVTPILFQGTGDRAYRDPAVYYRDGRFYLYCTYVDNCVGGPYLYIGMSTSEDLTHWSAMTLLTERDKRLNYSSPGNVFYHNGRYYMSLQTYCRENGEQYGNGNSRIFLMESENLLDWGSPMPLLVKGDIPLEKLGRMIDPYVIRDRTDESLFWCFYKQDGVSFSHSRDLIHWEYGGHTACGENVCVLTAGDEYRILHSPENGIGILRSRDLRKFEEFAPPTFLGQKDWSWAGGRITAGFVLDLTRDARYGKYLLFFHGSGPQDERVCFDHDASIGIAWSGDLLHWEWPGTV